eukprot:CAMPEP_0175955136 /NCGR_PEP_ID=MMETSP0108-20121206/32337_1 /TAXON_ID=195067 ORGANISM="Goniomonas pacifica, Strain CCMP1869" /NCGR_SAMPLE_ID=MMETSP0108 /ASSEMBLY_ACC=CAM_ASM_000204 /LENGTH=43 /DNA_ID= /DNA_START= /DNA_END= /DNA_ORIENTATION=
MTSFNVGQIKKKPHKVTAVIPWVGGPPASMTTRCSSLGSTKQS